MQVAKEHDAMPKELKAVDVSPVPELLRLVDEVRRTKEPRVLHRDGEDVAVLMPVSAARKRRPAGPKRQAGTAATRFTIESAAGSVTPATRTEDIEARIRDAKEEHAERTIGKLLWQ